MTAKIISGTTIAAEIREELKSEVENLKARHNIQPGLVTILVGKNAASVSYVTAKGKTAHELGFYSIQDDQPETISEDDLLKLIQKYNTDPGFTVYWCSCRYPNISMRIKFFMPLIRTRM